MTFTLRIDLDYVPWDTPDAEEYGHGEPAVLLRLLDFARYRGHKYHFFASNRALRAFPSHSEAVLNEGHDLDWFCKHPEAPDARFSEALELFGNAGHVPMGMCIRNEWPADHPHFAGIESLKFLSAPEGFSPPGLRLFPVEVRPLREGLRGGLSARAWCDSAKASLRDAASRNRSITIAIRPQVMARHDHKLNYLREITDLVPAVGMRFATLRDVLQDGE